MTDPNPLIGITPPLRTRAERADEGRATRERLPLKALGELAPPDPGRDPLAILAAQDVRRVQELVPIRYGRMSPTPFTFLRGSAAVMAHDLAQLPNSGITVQLCGDAHVSNFGGFSAPDRRLVVDVNDFDETLPGPFEWDVKRLAASAVVAARDNGFDADVAKKAARATAASYRQGIATGAQLDPLAVWYFRVELDELAQDPRFALTDSDRARLERMRAKAARKTSLGALEKLTELVDGHRRIIDTPPLVTRLDPADLETLHPEITQFFGEYHDSLPRDRCTLLDRYTVVDAARKVVGVGSVGTRCLILLLESGDGEPLFLQLKEATRSVLEDFLGPSEFPNAGQRVVEGQRVVQSASDVFLGFTRLQVGEESTDFYIRQLWDGKISADLAVMGTKRLVRYSQMCGAVLARAHCRSGDAAMIAGYLGDDDTFDRAVTKFAVRYAERTDGDHARMADAIAAGELTAASGY